MNRPDNDRLALAKAETRRSAGKVRKLLHDEFSEVAGRQLSEVSLPVTSNGEMSTISGFYPYMSEIDVLWLLAKAADDGWLTCLPVVVGEGRPLVFREWKVGEETMPGAWNIPVPLESATVVEPDVMLVPMLAFDRAGYRLGYGGGFYDRTLEMLRRRKKVVAIGVAFAGQQMDEVPHGEYDQRLDWVLTEKGAIRCA